MYDFENLTLNTPIHGQDNWFVQSSHSMIDNGGVCPPAAGSALPPDIVNTATSGSYTGSKALRNTNWAFGGQSSILSRVNDANWSFPSFVGATGIILEVDVAGNWWGKFLRLGYDANGDNNFSTSCVDTDPNEASFGLSVVQGNLNLHGANGTIIASGARPAEWVRLRLCIDVNANGGQGIASVFYITHPTSTNWISHSISGVNIGLNATATNQTNPQNLNGLIVEQDAGGTGFFDNISVAVHYNNPFDGCIVALPVELVKFQATAQENRWIDLNWHTVSETNNDYFEIYRSVDLNHWEFVTQVDGAGNSSESLHYTTADLTPHTGLSYYKLVQVDFNGTSSTSLVRSVIISHENNDELSIYPNPTSGTLKITGKQHQLNHLHLLNSVGQHVEMNVLAKGAENITIDVTHLSSGVYLLRSEEKSYKIIKE